jgi:hypothetical protein
LSTPPQADNGLPTEGEVEARMRPGAFSRSGFLGPEERLADVLAADARTLATLRLDHAQIADKLDILLRAAEASPARTASVGMLECRVQVHQGFQICPWSGDLRRARCTVGQGTRHASIDWRITNLQTGEAMQGPGLIAHLIGDHHFFEGTMSPNRVDPAQLATLLGLL